VRWCPADAGWHAGVETAINSASTTFLAITSASTAVVPRTVTALARYIDRRCAWVQTLAVAPEQRRPLEHLDQLLVGPSVDARRAAAWTGAGSLVVVAAIRSVGLEQGTLGATIALQSRGWHGRGVRGTLALTQGDPSVAAAAEQSVDTVARRLRVLGTRRSPLWARRVPLDQRLVHLRALVDDLAGSAYAVAVAVTVGALLTGIVPVPVNATVLLALAVTAALAAAARWMLSAGLLRRPRRVDRRAGSCHRHRWSQTGRRGRVRQRGRPRPASRDAHPPGRDGGRGGPRGGTGGACRAVDRG
jgi:hypothetical protein